MSDTLNKEKLACYFNGASSQHFKIYCSFTFNWPVVGNLQNNHYVYYMIHCPKFFYKTDFLANVMKQETERVL